MYLTSHYSLHQQFTSRLQWLGCHAYNVCDILFVAAYYFPEIGTTSSRWIKSFIVEFFSFACVVTPNLIGGSVSWVPCNEQNFVVM